MAWSGSSWTPNPAELEMLARQEREAREAVNAARERHMTDGGEIPPEHHGLIKKLEQEWERARARLERHRRS